MKTWFASTLATLAFGASAHAAPLPSGAHITRDPTSGLIRTVRALRTPTTGTTPAARAEAFLTTYGAALGLDPATLVAPRTDALPSGHVIRFSQKISNIPVEDRSLIIQLSPDGAVTRVTSDVFPIDLALPAHRLTPSAIQATLHARFAITATGTPTEVILAPRPGLARLAFRTPVTVLPFTAHFLVWLDAETGETLQIRPAAADQALRTLPLKDASR